MKVKEIIQRVQNLYSKGVPSDDSRLPNRLIYNKTITTRSKLISQEVNKHKKISSWMYQTLPCVKLILVPSHECPCMPPIGCKILRTEEKLPEPLMGLNGSVIKQVSSIDKSIKIDEISLNAVNSRMGNKYTNNKINYFLHDGYLYIVSTTTLKSISITALFEDPIEAKYYKGLCDTCNDCVSCIDYLEEDFLIDNDLIDVLVELTLNELVVLFSQMQEDLTNNSRDSLKENSK